MEKYKKIIVGSINPVKVEAVKESIIEYPMLSKVSVTGLKIKSIVSEQPKSMDETIKGAINRAREAQKQGDLGIGIEDGLVKVPHTKSEYMNACVCAIYDGNEIHLGMSSLFEYPKKVIELTIKEGIDISEAVYKLGITKKKKLGYEEGMISILTNGRLNRKEYTKQSIMMALIHLENKKIR